MSLLISLKQRIKSIETIRKITHAMRLISMSNNARLRGQKNTIEAYQQEINRLTSLLKTSFPSSSFPQPDNKQVIIIVGSEKGLCGTFNTVLIRFIENFLHNRSLENTYFIAIGKQLMNATPLQKLTFEYTFPAFNQHNLTEVVRKLTSIIIENSYKEVTIISTYPQTFFIQTPQVTSLTIATQHSSITQNSEQQASFAMEGNSVHMYDFLTRLQIQSTLQMLLFQSLLAEQAARFISMDSATQNAKNLLETMKLDYNKVRQALITRELNDLTSSII